MTRGYLQMLRVDDDQRRVSVAAYLVEHRRTRSEDEGAVMWDVLVVET